MNVQLCLKGIFDERILQQGKWSTFPWRSAIECSGAGTLCAEGERERPGIFSAFLPSLATASFLQISVWETTRCIALVAWQSTANSTVLLGNPWGEITTCGQSEGIGWKKPPEFVKEKSGKEGFGDFVKIQLIHLRQQKASFAFSCKIC